MAEPAGLVAVDVDGPSVLACKPLHRLLELVAAVEASLRRLLELVAAVEASLRRLLELVAAVELSPQCATTTLTWQRLWHFSRPNCPMTRSFWRLMLFCSL